MLELLANENSDDGTHNQGPKRWNPKFQRVATKDWLMAGYQLPVWRIQPFSVQKFAPYPSPEAPLVMDVQTLHTERLDAPDWQLITGHQPVFGLPSFELRIPPLRSLVTSAYPTFR